jgi:hypothetical protein
MDDAYRMSEATAADAEAILDIDRNVYSGRDYLPYCIKNWIDESKTTRRNFVLRESDSGRIVAYLSVGSVVHSPTSLSDIKNTETGILRTVYMIHTVIVCIRRRHTLGLLNAKALLIKNVASPTTVAMSSVIDSGRGSVGLLRAHCRNKTL